MQISKAKQLSQHQWNRPEMPDDGTHLGIFLGLLLIAGGVLGTIVGVAGEYPDPLVAMAGQGAAGIGIFMMSLGMILREIRRMAFEAAIRAGETTTE